MRVFVGVEIGQKRNQPAICVAEQEYREVDQRKETHYLVRHLERMLQASSYPAVATRVGEIVTGVKAITDLDSTIFVNATGTGAPVIDLIAEQARDREIIWPVYFNHGDRRKEEWESELKVTLGKAYLVTRLQTLLQTDRLHLPRTSEAEALAQKLLDYEVTVDEHANDHYGAFSVGTHDDLVMALGLAVQVDCPKYPRVYSYIPDGIYHPIKL